MTDLEYTIETLHRLEQQLNIKHNDVATILAQARLRIENEVL